MTLRTAAHSDIGLVRPENEDSILRDDACGLYAVADGIGGLPAGAQASHLTVEVLDAWIRERRAAGNYDYKACVADMNRRVAELGRVLSPHYGIGSTLTAAHFTDDSVVVIQVGDSTMYRLRDGELEVLTTEHNLGNEIRRRMARGESVAAFGENRAALTRCIGQPTPVQPDIDTHAVKPGDRYLLCTDGISRCIHIPELTRRMKEATDPVVLCRQLTTRANEQGGIDNASVVVVFVT